MSLKVNERTSKTRFKRQHNKLVDSVPVKISVANIEQLTDEELSSLKCGDIVAKITGNQKHCYIVTYKEENHGICLTYCDGSGYIETISYDYVGGHWTYNSKDVFNGASKNDVKDIIESGQVENAKPIYWHSVNLKRITSGELIYYLDFIIINNSIEPLTKESFMNWLNANPSVEIKVVQGYELSHASNLVSYFKIGSTNAHIKVTSINLSTGAEENEEWVVLSSADAILTDNGVNKLN